MIVPEKYLMGFDKTARKQCGCNILSSRAQSFGSELGDDGNMAAVFAQCVQAGARPANENKICFDPRIIKDLF